MGTTTTISIDRFRRRKAEAAAIEAAGATSELDAAMVGISLGSLERRYGLMSSEEPIVVTQVLATSGDLAVADRLAFVAAMQRHEAIVVIAVDGWFLACATERALSASELPAVRVPADGSAPRIMSLATDRGITPALGPLVA